MRTLIIKNGLIPYSFHVFMASVLAYFCISYSVTISHSRPYVGETMDPVVSGVTIHWMRPVFNLRIDPNQLSSGSDTVSSLSLPSGNITGEASNTPKKRGPREF